MVDLASHADAVRPRMRQGVGMEGYGWPRDYRGSSENFNVNKIMILPQFSRVVQFTHLHTHFIFFFLQQNNLDYVEPQIANLLFEAGQSSTNIGYNI